MKLTLLDLTQNILSSLNSDEVNSIGDTAESMQVANCIKTSYLNMQGRYDLPEHNQLFSLTPSDNPSQPTLMFRPDGVNRVEWIRYFDTNPQDTVSVAEVADHDINTDITNPPGWKTTSTTTNTIGLGSKTFTVGAGVGIHVGDSVFAVSGTAEMIGTVLSYSGTTLVINVTSTISTGTFPLWNISQNQTLTFGPGYLPIKIMDPQDFLDYTNSFDSSASDVGSFNLTINQGSTLAPSSFTFKYKNDKTPQYCCIISNYYFIFDSYDNTQDSTLQASKSLCFGWVIPKFMMQDTFIPNLDEAQVPMLLNEAKSLAFLELKNRPHQKAEQEVLRQLSSLSKFKALANRPSPFEQLPNFGRL